MVLLNWGKPGNLIFSSALATMKLIHDLPRTPKLKRGGILIPRLQQVKSQAYLSAGITYGFY